MEALGEEGRSALPSRGTITPTPPPPAAEDPTEGRRARRSVNYALPKLNSKMRRPEDYVPAIKGARKSVVPRAPGAAVRQSVQPTSSSQPERAAVREAVTRPSASQPSAGAGKPTSRRSAKAEEEEGEDGSEAEEVVVERIKQRRASSLAASKAMREMEERMREVDGAVVRPTGRRQSALA